VECGRGGQSSSQTLDHEVPVGAAEMGGHDHDDPVTLPVARRLLPCLLTRTSMSGAKRVDGWVMWDMWANLGRGVTWLREAAWVNALTRLGRGRRERVHRPRRSLGHFVRGRTKAARLRPEMARRSEDDEHPELTEAQLPWNTAVERLLAGFTEVLSIGWR